MAQPTIAPRPQPAQKYSGGERRKSLRYACSKEAFCQPVRARNAEAEELAWLGDVLNVSAGGIALSLTRRFDTGTLLFVELASDATGQGRILGAQVVYTTLQASGSWRTGCRFLNKLNADEVALVSSATQA
jgi:hypothetical protein